MSAFFQTLPLLVAAAGVACLVLSVTMLRQARPGVAMMLDLWVAAGLLQLSVNAGWQALVSTAGIIAGCKLVLWAVVHPGQRQLFSRLGFAARLHNRE